MSPERVRLGGEPKSARIAPGAGEGALARLVDRLREEARREGEAAGETAALRRAASELDAAAARLDAWREESAAELARSAVELGVLVAGELVRGEVDAGRYDLERIVRETLHESGVGRAACTVHLHPADVASLAGVPFRASTSLQPDAEVQRGHVHVECDTGLFVRDLDELLSAVAARLRESVGR